MSKIIYYSDPEASFKLPTRTDLNALLKICTKKVPKCPPEGTYYCSYDFKKMFGNYAGVLFYTYLRTQDFPIWYLLREVVGGRNQRVRVWSKDEVLQVLLKGQTKTKFGMDERQVLFKKLQDIIAVTKPPSIKTAWID